jgi:beta-phosphoglucomutase-like phosphatase (HAD superfamily)
MSGNGDKRSHGIIFDVDGVIADTERVNAEVSIAVLREERPASSSSGSAENSGTRRGVWCIEEESGERGYAGPGSPGGPRSTER